MTGGSGFIGSHTAKFLNDYELCVYDLVKPNYDAEFVQGDVLDENRLSSCLDGSYAVLHFASLISVPSSFENVRKYVETNALGTASLLQALKKTEKKPKKLIVSSSASVYGEGAYACPIHGKVYPNPRSLEQLKVGAWEPRCPICGSELTPLPQREGDVLQPLSPYAVTKTSQEWLAEQVGQKLGMDVVILRYFNVFGPGQRPDSPYSGVISKFLALALQGKDLTVHEDGNQTRDYVHVDDVGIANAEAVNSQGSFTANVGTGRRVTVRKIAEIIAQKHRVGVKVGGYREGDIRHSVADVTVAREKMRFNAKRSIEDGLKEVDEWLRAQRTNPARRSHQVNYPALTDGASRFIDTLTPGIPRVFHPASQRRSHPRASPLRSIGKAPPSSLGLEAQISLFVTQKGSCKRAIRS